MTKYMKSTQARLEMLERQNRWLTIIAGATIITLLVAATGGPAVIRATSIQLVDGVRAELSLNGAAGGRHIKDEDGNDRILASHDSEGSGIYVNDDQGTTRFEIAQFAHGGVALHGPKSKGATVLYLKGEGVLRFFDDERNVTNQGVGSASDR
jgi:hypothetical protein